MVTKNRLYKQTMLYLVTRQGDFFNKYSFPHMQKSLQSTYACRGYKHSPSITDKKEGKEGFL